MFPSHQDLRDLEKTPFLKLKSNMRLNVPFRSRSKGLRKDKVETSRAITELSETQQKTPCTFNCKTFPK